MSAMTDLVGLIEGLAPSVDADMGGYVHLYGDGPAQELPDAAQAGANRYFVVEAVGVAGDGGIATADQPLRDEEWVIAIAYPLGPQVNEAAIRERAASDARLLLDQLGHFAVWSGTGIDVLNIGESMTTLERVDDAGGQPALLSQTPIRVQFYGD